MTQITRHAPLKNTALLMVTMERVQNRDYGLPGIVPFYGPSGFGKTFASVRVATEYNAYYIQAQSTWTAKALLQTLAKEMGLESKGTSFQLTQRIAEQLVLSNRPLMIDEMDHIVEKKLVEVVRDIYDASKATTILIGEQNMPNKLKRWERFHGRMLGDVKALPADLDDAKELRKVYASKINVSDDLLEEILRLSEGSVRRISVNLSLIQQFALTQGWDSVDLETWEDTNKGFFTGSASMKGL